MRHLEKKSRSVYYAAAAAAVRMPMTIVNKNTKEFLNVTYALNTYKSIC